jgi:hypothetical protein
MVLGGNGKTSQENLEQLEGVRLIMNHIQKKKPIKEQLNQ